VDRIIPEPLGGAHRDPGAAIASVGTAISAMIDGLAAKDRAALIRDRREKFLRMGAEGLAA
jgi:acetyl-CoA carboxylase carboxyl transferase subunit alpha